MNREGGIRGWRNYRKIWEYGWERGRRCKDNIIRKGNNEDSEKKSVDVWKNEGKEDLDKGSDREMGSEEGKDDRNEIDERRKKRKC